MSVEKKYDLVVIGSGLGGLICALIFAKEGKSVCVLEKNNQIGGSLQTFVRDKQIFDSGIHYVGGLDEGQTLNMYFKYFGLMDKINIQKLDEDGFEHIYIKNSKTPYKYGMGYDNFKKSLLYSFPDEELIIDQFIVDIKYTCNCFPTYNAEEGDENFLQLINIISVNFCDYLNKLTTNNELKNVLAATNMLHAGYDDTTPFYVHAMILNSYIESAYRFIDGGSQIARILSKQIRDLGGEIFKYSEVDHFEITDKVEYVCCKNGKFYYADTYISNIHPSVLMDKLSTPILRPAYKNRLKNIRNTTSVFIVNIILKKDQVKYRNYNLYYYKDDNVWKAVKNKKESWPAAVAIYFPLKKNKPIHVDSLTIMTYMDINDVKEWEHTYNTVNEPNSRGESYEQFKKSRAEQLINLASDIMPELRESIKKYYVSTPLTYRDFIATKDGSLYGYIKDNKDPLNLFISPKTRIPNLLMTGQNLHLHGVYGVTVTAIKTCSEIFGNNYIMNKIKNSI
jgi:all-trans-retinol 13,14-reductase